jgi:tagaturonate reductase
LATVVLLQSGSTTANLVGCAAFFNPTNILSVAQPYSKNGQGKPVKLLQFGTGMLLRGLVDEIVHIANENGKWEAAIAVVKSTNGTTDVFEQQHYQYHVFVTGVLEGKTIHTQHRNTSIAHVWQAQKDWVQIKAAFANPSLQFVVSNTTEAGLVYEVENILDAVPASFPGKLTALLFHRFQILPSSDLFVIPTELIENNGQVLKAHVLHHAKVNLLSASFIDWLEKHIHFCNSLVDRIVTKASKALVDQLSESDFLAIQTEPYYLWAIECKKQWHHCFDFAVDNSNVMIVEDIAYYRERKLRLLNGVHSFMACKGYLNEHNTVYEVMQNEQMQFFLKQLLAEMIPSVKPPYQHQLVEFATTVLERFANPHLKHVLLDICFECTAKMKHRNLPLLKQWYTLTDKVPIAMAEGFAWYILFMKSSIQNQQYVGRRNGDQYAVRDVSADFYYYLWKDFEVKGDFQSLVFQVCKNEALWGTDLSLLPGFAHAVAGQLALIISNIGVE